jgi:DNA-binding GntR family transcriptional regulator
MKNGEPKVRDSLSRVAYDSVFQMILSRELPGGTVIQERKLAETLGISRTPMREALVRLEGEGWLARLTDRLLSVKVIDLTEFLHALSVRRLLECEAIRNAAIKLPDEEIDRLSRMLTDLKADPDPDNQVHWSFDDELHKAIAVSGGNPVLARIVNDLRKTTHLFEAQTVPQRLSPGIAEHEAILKALAAHDPELAVEAMQMHLERVRAGVMDNL